MATLVTFNGVQYSVPAYDDSGWAQGSGNLSSYLIALATGSLQQTGGNFTLSADANFGASFGLVSLYYKSFSSNIASAGVVRLANTDAIDWRNFANSGNNVLAVDALDRLTYNGVVVGAAGSGTVNAGTQYQLAYYATSTNAVNGDAAITTNAANQLLVPVGSVSAPSYSFTGHTGTGLWELSDTLLFSANGVQTFQVAATEIDVVGVPLRMNANKILNLTNGSSAQDAVAFNQLTTGNAITAGGIANNTITATQITNATITSTQVASNTLTGSTANTGGSAGNIDQGTISTPDLRANAVTNPQYMVVGNVPIAGYTNYQTISITTIGGPVMVWGSIPFNLTSSAVTYEVFVTIYRSGQTNSVPGACGASIFTGTGQISPLAELTLSAVGVDNPVAGTYTYVLAYKIVGGATISSDPTALVALELRA